MFEISHRSGAFCRVEVNMRHVASLPKVHSQPPLVYPEEGEAI